MGDTATAVVSLETLTWPSPPPSPPGLPPLPPPERKLNATAGDQLECQFQPGIDLVVSSSSMSSGTQHQHHGHAVDSQSHCCALCAMKGGCSRFVFMPDSGTCVLVPNVPSKDIQRISNPATVAGRVFVAHGERSQRPHAKCEFDVGYGYAKGELGAGRPLDEPTITTQQDCCDACEQNPECVKLVFEKYGGGCQLFASFAEKYRTPGLIAGSISSRLALGSTGSHSFAADGGGMGSSAVADGNGPPPDPPFMAPPAPPNLITLVSSLPPMPPPGEGGTAQAVVAYASLTLSGIIFLSFLMCTYCFYHSEIQQFLHASSGGRFGRTKFSLLPKSLQELASNGEQKALTQDEGGGGGDKKKRKKGAQKMLAQKGPPPGEAFVIVETDAITQKKNVRVSECETLEELRARIMEEFGHLLKGCKEKDVVLLCWVPTIGGASEKDGSWMLVASASDMARVVACTSIKLGLKKLMSGADGFPVAFPTESAATKPPTRRAAKKEQQQGAAAAAPPPPLPPAAEPSLIGEPTAADEEEAAVPPTRAALPTAASMDAEERSDPEEEDAMLHHQQAMEQFKQQLQQQQQEQQVKQQQQQEMEALQQQIQELKQQSQMQQGLQQDIPAPVSAPQAPDDTTKDDDDDGSVVSLASLRSRRANTLRVAMPIEFNDEPVRKAKDSDNLSDFMVRAPPRRSTTLRTVDERPEPIAETLCADLLSPISQPSQPSQPMMSEPTRAKDSDNLSDFMVRAPPTRRSMTLRTVEERPEPIAETLCPDLLSPISPPMMSEPTHAKDSDSLSDFMVQASPSPRATVMLTPAVAAIAPPPSAPSPLAAPLPPATPPASAAGLAEPATEPHDTSISVGKRVEIVGLQKSHTELNGRVGVVTGFDEAKGKFRVRLGPSQVLALKPANLAVCPPPAKP